MGFLSFYFYIFLLAVVILYYAVPIRFRWYVLLAGSLAYFAAATTFRRELAVFLGIIVVSWALGLLQEQLYTANAACSPNGSHSKSSDESNTKTSTHISRFTRKIVLGISIVVVLFPMLLSRYSAGLYALETILQRDHVGIVVSIGLSFFTMQIIAYLVDIYRGRISAQRNLLKYTLFVSFFPQIIQGPIPRYEQLEPQLIQGHRFDETNISKGFMLIIWGFFLKLMIADKAGIVVDTVFASPYQYRGAYVLVAGILYCIQLYADFLACTTLAQGIAGLFGIHLIDNFSRPFFSLSIKEFWRRWHISLSTWLRDYIYFPLGGSRRGRLRKYFNLCLTFMISGLWHGSGIHYLIWGLMQAGYQITGELTEGARDHFWTAVGIAGNSRKRRWIRCCTTCFLFMISLIVFRAETLETGFFMIRSLFMYCNPWVLFGDSLLSLGLDGKDLNILISSILVLFVVSVRQERGGTGIRDRILSQPFYLRACLYICVIAVIWVFGTYGYGYNAADFIYGGF